MFLLCTRDWNQREHLDLDHVVTSIPRTKNILLSFGLGKDVSVDAIIRKLTFKKWRANIGSDEDFLVSNKLNTRFALKYRIPNSVIPVNVKFGSKYFVRPPRSTQEGQDFMLILDRDSIGINNSPQKEPISMYIIEQWLMDYLSMKGEIQKAV